jgi:hypothetical protein
LQNRSAAFSIGPLKGCKILMFDKKVATRNRTLIEMFASLQRIVTKINAISVVTANEIKAMDSPMTWRKMPSLGWDICNGVHRAAGGKNGTGALDGPSQARLGRGRRMDHPPGSPPCGSRMRRD